MFRARCFGAAREVTMPLVRISVRKGKRPAWRQELGEAVHEALVSTVGVPAADRF